MQLDKLARNRKAKSRTLHFLRNRPHLTEFLKHDLLVLGCDADAGVPHRDLRNFATHSGPYVDLSTSRSEFESVR